MSNTAEFAAYLPGIKARWEAEQAALRERRRLARQAARHIAEMLRTVYGADRVILFGSAAGRGPFDTRSDVDIAVDGIDPGVFFKAYADVMQLGEPFAVDLIDLKDCPPALLDVIERDGEAL